MLCDLQIFSGGVYPPSAIAQSLFLKEIVREVREREREREREIQRQTEVTSPMYR